MIAHHIGGRLRGRGIQKSAAAGLRLQLSLFRTGSAMSAPWMNGAAIAIASTRSIVALSVAASMETRLSVRTSG